MAHVFGHPCTSKRTDILAKIVCLRSSISHLDQPSHATSCPLHPLCNTALLTKSTAEPPPKRSRCCPSWWPCRWTWGSWGAAGGSACTWTAPSTMNCFERVGCWRIAPSLIWNFKAVRWSKSLKSSEFHLTSHSGTVIGTSTYFVLISPCSRLDAGFMQPSKPKYVNEAVHKLSFRHLISACR